MIAAAVAGTIGGWLLVGAASYLAWRTGLVDRVLARRDPQGERAAHAVERGAVRQMSRESLENSAIELAEGSREQARRIHALEDALEQHRRECCSREDCALREVPA